MKSKTIFFFRDNIGFIKNFIYAFSAVILQIGVVQLVILPSISKTMSSEQYGLVLTLISIVDIIAITLGASICHVRLISISTYNDECVNGDFNKCCIIYGGISVVASMVTSLLYEKEFSGSTVLIGIMAFMAFFFSYSQVAIRLNRKFQYDIISSLLMAIGYFCGYLIYKLNGQWQFIYILGYGAGGLFCGVIIGKLYRESCICTLLFKKTNQQIIELSSSSFIKQLITYADRLILYPILGGELVAVYYAATLIGKMFSICTNPLNSLLLSYITKPKRGIRNYLMKIIFYSSALCFCVYWLCLIISKPVLLILYPQYYEAALSIIHITLLSAMVEVVISIVTPFTLKIFNTSLQVLVSIISTIVYFVSAVILLEKYSLIGFSIAVLLSSITKISIFILASLFNRNEDIVMGD